MNSEGKEKSRGETNVKKEVGMLKREEDDG
jgi:hypothetical protein